MSSLDDSISSSGSNNSTMDIMDYGEESGSDYEYESSSDNASIDDDIEEATSLFNQEPISCPICCDERVEEGLALTLPSCTHSFCTSCFNQYLEVQIGQGNADSITCPFVLEGEGRVMVGKQCNATVAMDVLHEIMTQESYDRLRQMKDAAFVRKNVDYHHCPTPDCSNVVLCKRVENSNDEVGASSSRICDCFKCGQTSCLTCGAHAFHANKTCNEHREGERLKNVAEVQLRIQRQLQAYKKKY